jgi:hypothetical protein
LPIRRAGAAEKDLVKVYTHISDTKEWAKEYRLHRETAIALGMHLIAVKKAHLPLFKLPLQELQV